MMTVVVLLMLAAVVLAWRQRRRWAGACTLAALAVFLLIGYGPLANLLLENLQLPYALAPTVRWAPSNMIIVLGAGVADVPGAQQLEPGVFAKGRIMQGAIHYRACKAANVRCMILLSGGDAKQHGAMEALVYRDYLISLGVAPADIVIEARSLNTWQNAQFAAEILKQSRPAQVLLVTSAVHMPRAMLYFEHFGVHAIPVRGDYLSVVHAPLPQSYNFLLADIALHEYVGTARYRIYNWFGLNNAGDHAGAV
ncbi:MAG: YdcF family protein [Burkholderiales bacterium]|nr:YdcF family protein [Burkholderiales bacterium]